MAKCTRSPSCKNQGDIQDGITYKYCSKHRDLHRIQQKKYQSNLDYSRCEYRCTNKQSTCRVCDQIIPKEAKRFRVPVYFNTHPNFQTFHYGCLPWECTKLLLTSTGPYDIQAAVDDLKRKVLDNLIDDYEVKLRDLKKRRIDIDDDDNDSDDDEDAQPDMLFN